MKISSNILKQTSRFYLGKIDRKFIIPRIST
jgi:hypothetical protein